jgi:hypothetical protein
VLHLDAHDPPACVVMAGRPRCGDNHFFRLRHHLEGLPEVLPLVDVLISSKDFPHRLTGISDERTSLVEPKGVTGVRLSA